MTPTWLQTALPAADIIFAMVVARSSMRCPALMVHAYTAACLSVLALNGWMPRDLSIPIRMCVSAALCGELLRWSRITSTPRATAAVACATLAVAAFLAGMQPWTLDYKLSLFRSHYKLGAALVAIGITIYRAYRPILECRRHKVYRIGVTAWLAITAMQGSFVRGGLGYQVVSYTPQRYELIGLAAYAALTLTVSGFAAAMLWVSPRRKVAAKTGDGWMRKGLRAEKARRIAA